MSIAFWNTIESKYSIATFFFLMARNKKLARNGVFDNKEHKEMVFWHEQEQMVPAP